MIAYLNGKITLKTPTFIYVECAGVGYHVNISLHTFAKIEILESVKILTYLDIKEDGHHLYGFFDDEERAIFIFLISVSGVGVNTARVILSYMSPEEVRSAIIHENDYAFSKVKGVGPKTSKRIILDLKDKLMKESIDTPISLPMTASPTVRQEAVSALMALGFQKPVIDKAIKTVMDNQTDITQVEDLIKLVLKQMS